MVDYRKGNKWKGVNFKAQRVRISRVKSYKYLGIELNPMLNWNEVKEICERKIRQKLRIINGLAVDMLVKVQLVQWMVVSIVNYGMGVVDYKKQWLEKWDKLIQSYVRKWAR